MQRRTGASGRSCAEFSTCRVRPTAPSSCANWLLENRDALVAPLASLEALISDPVATQPRYELRWPLPPEFARPDQISGATGENLRAAGRAWLDRLEARPGDVALLYCCGHGASLSTEPVLFLEDLNRSRENPWVHLQLATLGRSLRQHPSISCAYIFADACGESIAKFELGGAQEVRFYDPPEFGKASAFKVMLLSAAPDGMLAYEGRAGDGLPPLGRFTQTLVKALDGASVRKAKGQWVVNSSGLRDDLKPLKQFYFDQWADHAFEPAPVMTFNDVRQIVRPSRPVVPVLATTNPADLNGYRLIVSETPPPPSVDQPGTEPSEGGRAWKWELTPRDTSVYAMAFNTDACHSTMFTPNQPQFELQVDIT